MFVVNDKVVIKELRGAGIIDLNAAHGCGRYKDSVRLLCVQPVINIVLTGQIDCIAANGDNLTLFSIEAPRDSRAHHAPVTGDPYPFSLEIVVAS